MDNPEMGRTRQFMQALTALCEGLRSSRIDLKVLVSTHAAVLTEGVATDLGLVFLRWLYSRRRWDFLVLVLR